jgi:hypothetical protein
MLLLDVLSALPGVIWLANLNFHELCGAEFHIDLKEARSEWVFVHFEG